MGVREFIKKLNEKMALLDMPEENGRTLFKRKASQVGRKNVTKFFNY